MLQSLTLECRETHQSKSKLAVVHTKYLLEQIALPARQQRETADVPEEAIREVGAHPRDGLQLPAITLEVGIGADR